MANTQENRFGHVVEVWDSYDVILADTYALATALNKAKAVAVSAGAFGTVATTFSSWIDGLWEQYGDGRAFVSQPFAVLLLRTLIDEGCAGPALADTPNLPIAAAKCVARGSGIASFEAALADPSTAPAKLSAGEEALLRLLAVYRLRLKDHGFLERGEAVALLAEQGATCFAKPAKVCYVSDAPVPLLIAEFFAQLDGTLEFTHLTSSGEAFVEGPAPVASVPDGPTLGFALPAGNYAAVQLLGKMVCAASSEGPIVVAAKDPRVTFDALAGVCADANLNAAMRAQVPFGLTNIGQIYIALHSALEGSAGLRAFLAAADALRDPLFGMSSATVEDLQGRLRANRLTEADDAFALMEAESPLFATFLSFLREPSGEKLSSLQQAIADCRAYSPSERREAETALGILSYTLLGLMELGVPAHLVESKTYHLVEGAVVAISRANYAAGIGQEPNVLVVSLRQAASLEPKSCATAILWDLTGESYPAARKDNAVTTFLAHTGVVEPQDFQNMQRRSFSAVLNLPTAHVILGRCLHDADMKDLYPAAMLEEFLDANGIEVPAAPADSVLEGRLVESEDDLVADALGRRAPWGTTDAPPIAFASDDPARKAFLGVSRRDGKIIRSPSSLELYHDCPRKWFVSRWLNITTPGEDFGALERGSFIHACVQEFYRRFQTFGDSGSAARLRVTSDNLEDARALMREVVEACRREQYELDPYGWQTRYVALPGHVDEEASYERIQRSLADGWLEVESTFLTGTSFVPTLFEYSIDALGAELGGVAIKGRVDRIDIDNEGNLLVIDYKGGIGPEYHSLVAEGEPFAGRKIQTLIYAAAIRSVGHLTVPEDANEHQRARIELFNRACEDPASHPGRVAGAVYYSYNEKVTSPSVRTAGFFCVSSPLNAATLLISDKAVESCAVPAGEEDTFFGSITQTIAALYAGQDDGVIDALLPLTPGGELVPEAASICKYCPDQLCERRAG